MKPRVSVVIPTYNSARFLPRALESVFSQTYEDYEIIVVDDGSTDQTREVVRRFGNKISYVYQSNGGPAMARNTGIRLARGEYLAFLDADDQWLPMKLEKQVNFLQKHSHFSMVFTDMKHAEKGKILHESYLKEKNYRYVSSGFIYENLLRENFIFTPTVMVKQECLQRTGLFKEYLKIAEDHDLWLRISDEFPIGFLDEPLVIRNRDQGNITNDRYLFMISGIRMMEELSGRNRANRKRRRIIDEELGLRYFDLGYYFFASGQHSEARHYFWKSIQHQPQIKAALYSLASFFPPPCIKAVRRIKSRIFHKP